MQTPAQQIQEIYIGLLGRAADKPGLTYWVGEVASGKITIDQIRENFVQQQEEYAQDFGHLNRDQVVKALYQRLFDREAEPTGLEYWVNGGGKTVDIDRLVLALGDGAQVQDRTLLNNKIEAAQYYTDNVMSYLKDSAHQAVSLVNEDAATLNTSKKYTDSLAGKQPQSDENTSTGDLGPRFDLTETLVDLQSYDAATGNNAYLIKAGSDIQVANINNFSAGDALDIDETVFGSDNHFVLTDGINVQLVLGETQTNPSWFVNLNHLDTALVAEVAGAQNNLEALGVLNAALGDWII